MAMPRQYIPQATCDGGREALALVESPTLGHAHSCIENREIGVPSAGASIPNIPVHPFFFCVCVCARQLNPSDFVLLD